MIPGPPIPSPAWGAALESLDGVGAGDHDTAFVFGQQPRAAAPFPFSTRQFARLLILRSRIRTGLFAADDL